MMDRSAKHVLELVERIKPILAGQDPSEQGAVLAELLSLWLAGHRPPALREAILAHHIEAVLALTKINAHALHGE